MKNFFVIVLVLLISYSCSKQDISIFNREKTVVVIGDEKFYKKDIVEFVFFEVSEVEPATLNDKEFKKEILDRFIKHKLLVAEARKDNISIDKKLVRDVYEKLNTANSDKENNEASEKLMEEKLITQKFLNSKLKDYLKITNEDLLAYYREFIKSRSGKTYYHILQIVNEDKAKVEEAYRLIKSGKKFEDVAREFSFGPEAENGGDMGVIDLENFPQVFDVIKHMKKGEISKMISSEYGYHIFLLRDVILSENPSFEDVKEMLYDELIDAKKDQFLEEYLKEMMKNVKIEVNPDFDFSSDNSTNSKK